MSQVKPIPDGYHSITPGLIVSDSAAAIQFYEKAFGATELGRMAGPDGRIMHAEIKIGDSILMLNDEMPGMGAVGPQKLGGSPGSLHLYCDDADAVFNRAVAAGASVRMPMDDAFWGDRYGVVVDPFGHVWGIATRKRDLTDAETKRAMDDFFVQQQKK